LRKTEEKPQRLEKAVGLTGFIIIQFFLFKRASFIIYIQKRMTIVMQTFPFIHKKKRVNSRIKIKIAEKMDNNQNLNKIITKTHNIIS
jgi:hypothetical protein